MRESAERRVGSDIRGGGAEGNRTPDLVIANDALYQLSYSPGTGVVNRVHPAGGIAHSGGEVNKRGRRAASGAFLKKSTKKLLISRGRCW